MGTKLALEQEKALASTVSKDVNQVGTEHLLGNQLTEMEFAII